MSKSKVYTRKGDEGMTSLVGGKRVKKTDIRVEAYGTVDELNAQIGLLITLVNQPDECDKLQEIQGDLFLIGAYLATEAVQDESKATNLITASDVARIERFIDEAENGLPVWKGFILPGGSTAVAVCHVCRTVCRRAERRIIELSFKENVLPSVCAYMNRLSDYFYVLSRRLLYSEGKDEIIWKKRC